MPTLPDAMAIVDQLTPDERRELRVYLDEQQQMSEILKAGTMNVDLLLEAAGAIRVSMSEEDFEEMIAAMNEEYIEPVDEDAWLP